MKLVYTVLCAKYSSVAGKRFQILVMNI